MERYEKVIFISLGIVLSPLILMVLFVSYIALIEAIGAVIEMGFTSGCLAGFCR